MTAPVRGAERVVAGFRGLRIAVEARLREAQARNAERLLSVQRGMTPLDPDGPGPHVRNLLTVVTERDGLRVRVGLPSDALASEGFWFRFLDQGVQAQTVRYRRAGSQKRHIIQVPARQAQLILIRSLATVQAEAQAALQDAIAAAVREVRGR